MKNESTYNCKSKHRHRLQTLRHYYYYYINSKIHLINNVYIYLCKYVLHPLYSPLHSVRIVYLVYSG